MPVIDVKTGEVLRVDDYPDHPPIPMTRYDYDPDFLPPPDAPLKPLDVVQPDGVSFTIKDHAISWDKWTLAIGFTPREGLVLHDIRYDGRSVVRRLPWPNSSFPMDRRSTATPGRTSSMSGNTASASSPTRFASAAIASARSSISTPMLTDCKARW